MNVNKAQELATLLTLENQTTPPEARGRYSVEMIDTGGEPDFRVVRRDPKTYQDREVAR